MSVPGVQRTMVFILSVVLCGLSSQPMAWGKSTEAQDAQRVFDNGMHAFFGDDAETAIKHFREALQVDPDFPDAHWMLIWHGPEEERHELCRAIMRLDPHSEYAYVAKLLLEGKPLPVYGNPETWRFHLASCIGLPLNEMIRFKSAEEAVVAWYEGCPYCNADPNNLLAAQQAEHRKTEERFRKVMEAIRNTIAREMAGATIHRAQEDYHIDQAVTSSKASKIRRIERGTQVRDPISGDYVKTVTEEVVVAPEVRAQLKKKAGEHMLRAAWHASKAERHEYLATWAGDKLAERTAAYESEGHSRRSQRLQIEAGACVRQALDIRSNGRVQRAMQLVTRATELQPDNNSYQELLQETTWMWANELLKEATAACDNRDFDDAITFAGAVVLLYPANQQASELLQDASQRKLRRTLEQVGKLANAEAYQDAVTELQKAEKSVGPDSLVLETLPQVYYTTAQRRIEETRQQLLDGLTAKADDFFTDGKYEQARKHYEIAVQAGGEEGVLNHNIAVCQVFPDITRLYAQGKASQSWATYLQLLEAAARYEQETAAVLKDASSQAQLIRSLLLERAGDLPGAGEAYRCFARGSQPPSQASAEQAQACLAMAVQEASRVPPATFRSLSDEVLPALAYAVEAVRLYADSATAQAYTSLLFTALGHFDRAHIHALEAVKNDPAQPLSHTASLIDAILAKEGERATKEAEWLLGHAREIGYIHYLAACAFQLSGEVRRAQRELNIAAAKDPNFYSMVGSRPKLEQAFGHCMNAINQDMPSDVSPDQMDDFSVDALMTILTTARPMK